MNPRARRASKRAGTGVDVMGVRTGEPTDDGAIRRPNFGGNSSDRVDLLARSSREAGFDDVDAQAGELSRDIQLLRRLHRAPRRLLAITERSVEDAYLIVRHRRRFELCHIVPAKGWG